MQILTSDLEEVTKDHADFKTSFQQHFSVTFDLHAVILKIITNIIIL